MELNTQLLAFVYAINVHNALNAEQKQQVMDGTAYPDDFCDGNIVLAQAFVDLEYIKDIEDDIDTLMTDEYNNAWNTAYAIAVENKFFPWELECYWSKDAFVVEETKVERLGFFSTDNGYTVKEYELLYSLSIGETMQSPVYGNYHTIKRLK